MHVCIFDVTAYDLYHGSEVHVAFRRPVYPKERRNLNMPNLIYVY